jgi:hypothetical protein
VYGWTLVKSRQRMMDDDVDDDMDDFFVVVGVVVEPMSRPRMIRENKLVMVDTNNDNGCWVLLVLFFVEIIVLSVGLSLTSCIRFVESDNDVIHIFRGSIGVGFRCVRL